MYISSNNYLNLKFGLFFLSSPLANLLLSSVTHTHTSQSKFPKIKQYAVVRTSPVFPLGSPADSPLHSDPYPRTPRDPQWGSLIELLPLPHHRCWPTLSPREEAAMVVETLRNLPLGRAGFQTEWAEFQTWWAELRVEWWVWLVEVWPVSVPLAVSVLYPHHYYAEYYCTW